jgi:hypothetical protein
MLWTYPSKAEKREKEREELEWVVQCTVRGSTQIAARIAR